MSDLESKYSFIKSALDRRKKENRFRSLTTINPLPDGPEIEIDEQKMINFCSNDYLGLATHPEVIKRSKEFLEKYGAGSSSSRLISGTLSIHERFEQKLANTFGFESALIFNTGFQANVAILSAIADRNSLILLDKKCHNSLVQGAILSRAIIKRFNHNDSEQLESFLKEAQNSDFNRYIIVSETVFSMDGDRNNFDDLINLSKKHNALLYSDDAHALGVLGDRGLGLNYGAKGVDFNIGTFGKSFGGFGAFVGCSKEIKDYLINFASGFIYTTALPPAVIGGLDAALDLIPTMENERRQLFELIEYLKSKLFDSFELMKSDSQIVPILIGKESDTIKLSNYLLSKGLWVSAIRPPTVEKGASRLRITLTARHTKGQVDQLIEALKTGSMVEIHAYHGWGFNGSFWDDLSSEIPKEILFKAADRGYFGGEFEPEFSEVSTTKIVFAHSFGLHWCPQEKLKNTDVLIIFNGFGDFLPSDFFERRKELKILKRMHDQFKKAPESILNAFLENCFHPQRTDLSTPKWMNRSLLARDLIALRKTKFIIEKLDIKTISLTGSEDQIVSIKRTEELVKQIGAIESGIIDGSGHALPIVNSSDCWSYLIEVVPIFAEYANKNGFK